MPRIISSFALQEKNKLASGAVWMLNLEITIPDVAEPVRITSNSQSVTWRGHSWVAFPFDLGDLSEESTGEIPSSSLRVSNVSRVMEAYLQAYDLYQKTSGVSPIVITIYVICDQGLTSEGIITDESEMGAVTEGGVSGAYTDEAYEITNPDPEAEFLYEVVSQSSDSEWATFHLGAANPYNRRFPPHRTLKNHCPNVFKDALCGYAGAQTVCDKTLARCRVLGNSTRFGGCPGVGMGGLRVA